MALPELRGTGRLLTDPRTGTTNSGTPWTSATIKFPTWKKTDDGWEETDGVIARVRTFDDNAQLLAGYRKGDDVGIHGTCRPNVWNDKPQLDITGSQVWTPEKTNRGKGRVTTDDGSTASLAEARAAASAALRQIPRRTEDAA